ncbi:MAG: peptide deformylase [Deltaproteobacteria bacterium]|nr:peptide deformylase [Deltaproteobacteria bacterium]
MPVLKILQYPDPVLREKSHDIESIREEERALINDLIDTMRSSKGVGLAAVQVGVLKRIVAVDRTPENPGHGLIVLANPVITESSGLKTVREGCLSIPQYLADIKRKERITVRGLDFKGEPVAIESSGLLSVALQHEIDHLDGILFIDRIEGVRGLLKRKVRGKN